MAGADRRARLSRIESDSAADHFKPAGDRQRTLYARQLPDCLRQYPAPPGARKLTGTRRRRRPARHAVWRSDRVGDFAHGYAGQGVRPADGVRRFCDAALSWRHRLDSPGGPEFRMAQQGLDGVDRRRARHFQYLFDDGPDPGRSRDVVSIHFCIHEFRARPGVVGNGRCREYTGRPHASDDAADNIAAGDAGDHRRRHHQLSGSDRIVRRARADRIACPLQRGLDAALAIFRISGPRRGSGGLRNAAARHYRADVLAAALAARSQRLHLRHRQGRRTADDRAGALALGHARLCAVRLRAFGFSSHDGAAPGCLCQGLGPRVQPRQSDAFTTSTIFWSSRPRRSRRSSTPSSIRE